jgi:hypothetical protein
MAQAIVEAYNTMRARSVTWTMRYVMSSFCNQNRTRSANLITRKRLTKNHYTVLQITIQWNVLNTVYSTRWQHWMKAGVKRRIYHSRIISWYSKFEYNTLHINMPIWGSATTTYRIYKLKEYETVSRFIQQINQWNRA